MNFKNKIILAPLAAVNNIAFRKLCSDYGADIVYSQMIDSVAFLRGAEKSKISGTSKNKIFVGNKRFADFFDEDNLVAQFFGNDSKIIAKCAKEIEDKVQGVDLNLGCPHSDVVKRECGSYLMKFPDRVKGIVRALVKTVKVPVTVKIRAGYDGNNINAVKIAKLCEKEGVAAIAVHGRARTVNYEKPVDYPIIKKVKEAVNVPVIGNGDIFDGESAKKMFELTDCDSVMVARGAIGKPWIFDEIKDFLKGKKSKEVDRKKVFARFMKYAKKYKVDFKDIKTQAQWFTKGVKHGGKYRLLMNKAKDVNSLKEVYNTI